VLSRLAGSPHRPQLVLTRPDRPRGRGRKVSAPAVADAARALGIAVQQPASVNDPAVCELLEQTDATSDAAGQVDGLVLVVCAFGALIKEPLLSRYPLLNVHPSLLPRWRGAAPIERAIIAGDAQTGVSIMRLTAGLDSGPVCATVAQPIGAQDTYGSLAERLQALGGELLVGVLDSWEAGGPPRFVEQDERGATYAEKLGGEDRLLDPSRPAVELERTVRALQPHVGARVKLAKGGLLGVLRATLAGQAPAEDPPERRGTDTDASSLGLAVDGGRLLLRCAHGTLELLEVQPPGGRPMDASAYLRGHAL
jgi:methionyl-tRNA formyltransferase